MGKRTSDRGGSGGGDPPSQGNGGGAIVPVKQFMEAYINKGMREQLAAALPKHIRLDYMLRVFRTALTVNPALMECPAGSILAALLEASQLGLPPDGFLGMAYLIPRRNKHTRHKECQLQVGYRGLLELARRSGQIKSIMTECVYEKDRFKYMLGLEPKIEHVPCEDADRGKLKAVYAIAWLKGGGYQFVVMRKADVEKRRNASQANTTSDDSPWVKWTEKQWEKTALIQLTKRLPASTEALRAVMLDDLAEAGKSQPFEMSLGEPPAELPPATDGEITTAEEAFRERQEAARRELERQQAELVGHDEEPPGDDGDDGDNGVPDTAVTAEPGELV